MTLFNTVIAGALDVVLYPFRPFPPLVGLLAVSLVTAAAMMLVFKKASNQEKIADVKRKIVAALFEIRLFNDDLRAVFRAQRDLLRHNATYLRLSLAPLLILLIPMATLIAHLDAHYAYTGLRPREPVLIEVQLRPDVQLSNDAAASLDAPPAVRLLTPAVVFPASHEILWRIEPETAGTYEVVARVGDQRITKRVDATDRVVRRSPTRVEAGLMNEFLHPAESPLPAGGPVKSISVPYPSRGIRVLGSDANWILVYFVATMVFALLLRKPLGVTL